MQNQIQDEMMYGVARQYPGSDEEYMMTQTGYDGLEMPDPQSMGDILRQYIGRPVRMRFFIAGTAVEKVGRLIEVGSNFVMTQSAEPSVVEISDLFSLKFVSVILDDGETADR